MKRYVIPHISVTAVDTEDIVTMSVGNGNSTSLDFGKDFLAGLGTGSSGSTNSVGWNDFN